MKPAVKVAFATGDDSLNRQLIDRLKALYPELPLYVVSEFPPAEGPWIPYHPLRGFRENLARCRAPLRGKRIRLAGVLLQPNVPYRRLRLIALLLSPLGFIAYNENLDHFMLRPRSLPTIFGHFLWRGKNLVRFELNPGGHLYTFFWRLARPREWRRPLAHLAAIAAGWKVALLKALLPARRDLSLLADPSAGISVVIPSRNGRQLLASLLPGVANELAGTASEIIVVDNGSDDGTAEFLGADHPEIAIEHSATPLAFAAAVNRGLRRARYSRVCLLNSDMTIEPGFFAALVRAFDETPELFCATAQILFPEGARRQETGKAVMPPPAARARADFPVRCEPPVPGEDLSYVLYGSGGCSMYAAAKLRALGGLDEIYAPAYVEDLDLGYRAWQRGWPTVFVAGARVLHQHRATTSRYYTDAQLDTFLETNYLRFLVRSAGSARIFRRLWREAIRRLNARAAYGHAPSRTALGSAWRAPFWIRRTARAGPLTTARAGPLTTA
ncbi:MAG: glycosyltransferase, partial [Acidobacteriota bacterium]